MANFKKSVIVENTRQKIVLEYEKDNQTWNAVYQSLKKGNKKPRVNILKSGVTKITYYEPLNS